LLDGFFWGESSWLDCGGVCFVAKDIGILVGLSCSWRLNGITSELPISSFVTLMSSLLGSLESIESDVTLEGPSVSQSLTHIRRLVLMREDIVSYSCVELISSVSHFKSIYFLFD
jgi:hypothetical protein